MRHFQQQKGPNGKIVRAVVDEKLLFLWIDLLVTHNITHTFSVGARFLAKGGRGGVDPPRTAEDVALVETTDRLSKGASAFAAFPDILVLIY